MAGVECEVAVAVEVSCTAPRSHRIAIIPPVSDTPAKHDPYAAFRHSGYRMYAMGVLATLIGTRIQATALVWEVYLRTDEAMSLAIVGLVQAVPVITLSLPSGYLADVFNRRVLIVLGLIGATLTSLGLAAASYHEVDVYWLYVLVGLDATALTLARPARMALMPQIVPKADFPNAVAWNSSLFQISSVVGPAIGGFVIAWSVPAAYLISASGTVIFLLAFSRVRLLRPQEKGSNLRPLQSLVEGIQFVWRKRLLMTVISLDMFAVMLGGAVYLLPIFAKDILEVGETGYGWLNAAPAAGAFLMALLVAHAPPMKRAGRNLLLAVAGFGVATVIFGYSTNFWLSMVMLFATGALDNISVVIRHTLVQTLTPDSMRGRVSAVNGVFIGASNEIGGFESGVVAQWFGPVFSVVSGGVGCIAVVLASAVASPKLRRLRSLTDTEDHDTEAPNSDVEVSVK